MIPSYFSLPDETAPQVVKPEYRDVRGEQDTIPTIELLSGMTLREFRASGLVVVVRCAVLGDEVVWAADGTPTSLHATDDKGRVVYRGEELRLLTLLGPDDLRAYHELRKQVGEVQVESIGLDTPEEVKPEDPTKKKKGRAA